MGIQANPGRDVSENFRPDKVECGEPVTQGHEQAEHASVGRGSNAQIL
jgi:hypothetical protein